MRHVNVGRRMNKFLAMTRSRPVNAPHRALSHTVARAAVMVVMMTLLAAALVVGSNGARAQAAAQSDPHPAAEPASKRPITLDILDDDALLLISRGDGRDIVHVSGRARILHKDRTVWTDELLYDEQQSYAVMDGAVELVDEGDDGLNLTADHLELDLNTEAASARGDVQFERKETRGRADTLRYGEFSALRADIEAGLADRPQSVADRVLAAMSGFLADDEVLLLQGAVDLIDGDRQFRSDFVVINTRDDALVSIGRSVATLPGPEDD